MIDNINFSENILINHEYYILIMICDVLFVFFSNSNYSLINAFASFQLYKYRSISIILFLVILPFRKQFAVYLIRNVMPS